MAHSWRSLDDHWYLTESQGVHSLMCDGWVVAEFGKCGAGEWRRFRKPVDPIPTEIKAKLPAPFQALLS